MTCMQYARILQLSPGVCYEFWRADPLSFQCGSLKPTWAQTPLVEVWQGYIGQILGSSCPIFLRNIKVENCFKAGASSGLWCKNRELWLRLPPQVLLPLGEPDHGPGTWPEDTMLGLEHITYPILIILVSNHISTYCVLMFFGELLADGTPHGPFPSRVPDGPIVTVQSSWGTRWLPTTNAWKFVVSGWSKRPGDSEVTCGMVTLW